MALATIAVVLVVCGGWIAWQFGPYGRMAVLPHVVPGEWIRYDYARRFQIRPRVALPCRFRTTFHLDRMPAQAVMRLRAYQSATVELNGDAVDFHEVTPASWKHAVSVEVGRWLRAGTNELEVEVVCDRGPPLLWLVIQTTDGTTLVESGTGWEASWAGASWRAVRLANEFPRWHRTELRRAVESEARSAPLGLTRFTVPIAELTRRELNDCLVPRSMWWRHRRWWLWLGIAIIAASAVGSRRWRGATKEIAAERTDPNEGAAPDDQPAVPIDRRLEIAMFVGVVALWAALIWHNRLLLYPQAGYDASGHLEYVQFILDHRRLPLATDGWQMYQPPLYYVCSAVLLGAAGLSTHDPAGIALLRLEGMVIGVGLILVTWVCLKRLFPENPRRWKAGGLVAAFLPASICLAHYPTNELLAALFCSLAVYFVLRIVGTQQETIAPGLPIAVGVMLGLAMLSKVTALVLVGATLVALAMLAAERRRSFRQWARVVVLPVATCLLVCGWHFGRVWYRLGVLFPSNADFSYPLWQDPGYLTTSFFWRIGEVWRHPYDAAVVSFADGLMSTWWGDGAYGGTASDYLRPPWNYEWMAAGYLWALLPTVCVLVGTACAAWRFVRKPSTPWFFMAVAACGMVVILLQVLVIVPTFSFVKGFYALPLLVPFCALAGWGFDAIARRHRGIAFGLWITLGIWAANSYLSFWIDPTDPTTRLMQAQAAVLRNDYRTAARLYNGLLRENPRNVGAWYHMATALLRTDQVERSLQAYRRLLAIAPDHAQGHVGLAMALAELGELDEAIDETRRGLELGAGSGGWPQFFLGQLLDEKGETGKALDWYRQALRFTPHNAKLHRHVARAWLRLGRSAEATQHLAWAEAIEAQQVIDL